MTAWVLGSAVFLSIPIIDVFSCSAERRACINLGAIMLLVARKIRIRERIPVTRGIPNKTYIGIYPRQTLIRSRARAEINLKNTHTFAGIYIPVK